MQFFIMNKDRTYISMLSILYLPLCMSYQDNYKDVSVTDIV